MNGFKMILAAAKLAKRAHKNQKRKQGTPYFTHPKAVARLLWNLDYKSPDLIAAAYTHDVLEDAPQFAAELKTTLSEEAYRLVEAVTKKKGESLEGHYYRILLAGTEARILKQADRNHNNSEVSMLPKEHPTYQAAIVKTKLMLRIFGLKTIAITGK